MPTSSGEHRHDRGVRDVVRAGHAQVDVDGRTRAAQLERAWRRSSTTPLTRQAVRRAATHAAPRHDVRSRHPSHALVVAPRNDRAARACEEFGERALERLERP